MTNQDKEVRELLKAIYPELDDRLVDKLLSIHSAALSEMKIILSGQSSALDAMYREIYTTLIGVYRSHPLSTTGEFLKIVHLATDTFDLAHKVGQEEIERRRKNS